MVGLGNPVVMDTACPLSQQGAVRSPDAYIHPRDAHELAWEAALGV